MTSGYSDAIARLERIIEQLASNGVGFTERQALHAAGEEIIAAAASRAAASGSGIKEVRLDELQAGPAGAGQRVSPAPPDRASVVSNGTAANDQACARSDVRDGSPIAESDGELRLGTEIQQPAVQKPRGVGPR